MLFEGEMHESPTTLDDEHKDTKDADHIEYWMRQGYSEVEAEDLLAKAKQRGDLGLHQKKNA